MSERETVRRIAIHPMAHFAVLLSMLNERGETLPEEIRAFLPTCEATLERHFAEAPTQPRLELPPQSRTSVEDVEQELDETWFVNDEPFSTAV